MNIDHGFNVEDEEISELKKIDNHIGSQKPYNYYNYTTSNSNAPKLKSSYHDDPITKPHTASTKYHYIPKPMQNNLMTNSINSVKSVNSKVNPNHASYSNNFKPQNEIKSSPYTEIVYSKNDPENDNKDEFFHNNTSKLNYLKTILRSIL